jgi:hypothetical protein
MPIAKGYLKPAVLEQNVDGFACANLGIGPNMQVSTDVYVIVQCKVH